MKKAGIYFLFLIIPALIFSCQSRSNQDILTGGNYKYWMFKNYGGKGKVFEYFDKTGKCLRFVKIFNGDFEKYSWADEITSNYWNMPKYKLINWRGNNFNIAELTDSIFVVGRDTLIAAPDSLIPVNYRKLQ